MVLACDGLAPQQEIGKREHVEVAIGCSERRDI